MDKEKHNNLHMLIIKILVLILMFTVSIAYICIQELFDSINEIKEDLDAYRDNYVALWTTVNTYHNIDMEE